MTPSRSKETVEQSEYFTTEEAANELGVSIKTIQTWTNNEKLEYIRTEGNHRRILKSSVEKLKTLNNRSTIDKAKDVLHIDFRDHPLDLVALYKVIEWAECWCLMTKYQRERGAKSWRLDENGNLKICSEIKDLEYMQTPEESILTNLK